jgi:hypothetical protein
VHRFGIELHLPDVVGGLARELLVGLKIHYRSSRKFPRGLSECEIHHAFRKGCILQRQQHRSFTPHIFLADDGRPPKNRMLKGGGHHLDGRLHLFLGDIEHTLLQCRYGSDFTPVRIELDRRENRMHESAETPPASAFLVRACRDFDLNVMVGRNGLRCGLVFHLVFAPA